MTFLLWTLGKVLFMMVLILQIFFVTLDFLNFLRRITHLIYVVIDLAILFQYFFDVLFRCVRCSCCIDDEV